MNFSPVFVIMLFNWLKGMAKQIHAQ